MTDLQIKDPAMDRYHSLALSSAWELAKIRQASALVVGAGALGNEVCKNLAMMGVALIVVLDRDTVEVANLSRSAFLIPMLHFSRLPGTWTRSWVWELSAAWT